MKRLLTGLLLTWSLATQAGLPPTTLSGQSATTKPTTFNFKTPYNQSTVTAEGGLIETANTNELVNSGFEKDFTTSLSPNYSITGATVAPNTSTPLAGKQSARLTTSGAMLMAQQSTINAAQQSGVQKTCSVYVSSTNANDIQLCSRVNSAEDKCTAVGGYTAGSGKRKLTVSFLGGSSASGCHLKSTASGNIIDVDDFTMGDGAPIVDFTNSTDWVAYTPTVTNLGTGSTTRVDGRWRRNGDSMEIQAGFVKDGSAGTGSNNVDISLPSGFSGDFNKIAGTANRLHKLGTALYQTSGSSQVVYGAYSSGAGIRFSNPTVGQGSELYGSQIAASSSLYVNAIIPIVGWGGKSSSAYVASGSTTLNNLHYLATITTTSGAVSATNVPSWISCGTGNPATCSFAAGIFTVAPVCTVGNNINGGFTVPKLGSMTASGFTIETYLTSTLGATGSQTVPIHCTKSGVDFTNAFKPIIVGSFSEIPSVPGTPNVSICGAIGTSGGVLSQQYGDCIASCSSTSTYTCNFTAGYWRATPVCTASSTGAGYIAEVQGLSVTSVGIRTADITGAGAPVANVGFAVTCIGPR